MRKTSTWIIIVASWALWLGCLYDPGPTPGGGGGGPGDVGSSGSYSVEAGTLAGDLPVVGEFEGDAYEIVASDYQVTLHAGERGGEFDGWAMTRLYIDLDEVMATPLSTTVEIEEPDATGCSGPQHGDWDWDRHTYDVTVTVHPGVDANERVVEFQTRYDDGNETHGEFTVRDVR